MSRYDVDAIIHAVFMFGIMIISQITKEVNSVGENWFLVSLLIYHAVSYIYCEFKRSKEDE